MAMTVDERLGRIDTSVALLDQRLEAHTSADEDNFIRLTEQLNSIESKVDLLRLSDAVRTSAVETTKRNAGVFGGSIAAGIVAIFEGVKYIVHG